MEDKLSIAPSEGGLVPSEDEDSTEHLHHSRCRLSIPLARPPLLFMLCGNPVSPPSQSVERSALESVRSRDELC